MTTYAYDPSARHLLATVEGGVGAVAHVVARLHERTPAELARRLATQLSLLSSEAWMAYTDPDSADPNPAAEVGAALRDPHLVVDGSVIVEPHWVVNRAHEVGRLLVEIGSAGARRAVAEDVAAELDSVERAALGDLSGRAAQAVLLSRLDAAPRQVAAADEFLAADPLGPEVLLTDVEPTAACVAAAHWLAAAVAVVVAARGAGDVTDVLDPGRAAEAFDVVAPTIVVTAVDVTGSPLAAVQGLVGPAMCVARGVLPDPEDCPVAGLVVLDPFRPSRHLLDRMLMALRAAAERYLDLRGDGTLTTYLEEVRIEATVRADRLLAAAPVPA